MLPKSVLKKRSSFVYKSMQNVQRTFCGYHFTAEIILLNALVAFNAVLWKKGVPMAVRKKGSISVRIVFDLLLVHLVPSHGVPYVGDVGDHEGDEQ